LPLPPLLLEWLGAVARTIHVLAAILWVGDSFLFMWMDSSLEAPRSLRDRDPKGPEGSNVVGELWMVHSGGFYEVVKRRSLTPAELPPHLVHHHGFIDADSNRRRNHDVIGVDALQHRDVKLRLTLR